MIDKEKFKANLKETIDTIVFVVVAVISDSINARSTSTSCVLTLEIAESFSSTL